jgi:hypothetical protein
MNPIQQLLNDPNVSGKFKEAASPDYDEEPLTKNDLDGEICYEAYMNCDNYDDYIQRAVEYGGVDRWDAETWWNEEQTKHQER